MTPKRSRGILIGLDPYSDEPLVYQYGVPEIIGRFT
jgi:hypothetical protein